MPQAVEEVEERTTRICPTTAQASLEGKYAKEEGDRGAAAGEVDRSHPSRNKAGRQGLRGADRRGRGKRPRGCARRIPGQEGDRHSHTHARSAPQGETTAT